MKPFVSKIFPGKELVFPGSKEWVAIGGRDMFPAAAKVLLSTSIYTIGVIGYGSQGHAHALNLRDSLKGVDITVRVGLSVGSASRAKAIADGFTEENGTLGETFDVIRKSDLVILLIPDSEQVRLYKEIFEAMRPGAFLGLAHGFLLGHLESVGEYFPDKFSVIGVCPKGVGPSVRWWYEQGRERNGAGIPCSFTVERDYGGAGDVALAWAILIGAPSVSWTTLRQEYRSDLVGERAVLLGGLWALVEETYRYFVANGMREEDAFNLAVEGITGPISDRISRHGGLLGLYREVSEKEGGVEEFARAYIVMYGPAKELIKQIYESVYSGDEIREVVAMANQPMKPIDGSDMWTVGKRVRENRGRMNWEIDPMVAGFYVAMMMAQVDVFRENGHYWSEVCNESIIEAIKSLSPLMHAKGVGFMVDSCSPTARLGTRKRGPQFMTVIREEVLPGFDQSMGMPSSETHLFQEFLTHPVHSALALCLHLVPQEDLYVGN
ncbi:MAG: ketol-acid reductoisomerase [Candidatus Moranbacteria bacterium]|nr:ketol-acid reductoisomerase [Candidatus Moranbacteria bacterium]NTW45976.1 ketol-acid reductoisomerase [Candidatus Moranbacteria bacterium]